MTPIAFCREVEFRTQGSSPRLRTQKNPRQGQGQPFQGQTLSRPKTGMLEAKAKYQGRNVKVIFKKKSSLQKFVNFPENSSVLQGRKRLQKFFRKLSGVLHDETRLVMTLAHFQ